VVQQEVAAGICGMCGGAEEIMLGFGGESKEEAAGICGMEQRK
jgi:hypothetical protein